MDKKENKSKVQRFVEDVVGGNNSRAYESLREIVKEKIVRKVKDTLGEDS